MSLCKLWEMVKVWEAWCTACSPWGHRNSDIAEWLNNKTKKHHITTSLFCPKGKIQSRSAIIYQKWTVFLLFILPICTHQVFSDTIYSDIFGNSYWLIFHEVQFSSVAQSCLTLCDPTNRSMPGLPVHHQLLESTQTHVHQVTSLKRNVSPEQQCSTIMFKLYEN